MLRLPDTATGEPTSRRLRQRVEAEAYVASVCFKHGPPERIGVELEWTVHHTDDPRRPLDAAHLAAALGDHAPRSLAPDSPALPLPGGSPISVEPGGQVEISALPQRNLTDLFRIVSADLATLTALLADAGLRLGDSGTDPFRPPQRVLRTPRYEAMEQAFAPLGSDGITMMCNTAGLQVCVDAGEQADLPTRWAAVHALGPVLLALFANSAEPGWVSARTRTVHGTDPRRTKPGPVGPDPAWAWARRAVDTPVLCVRRPDGSWDAPPGMTFADWTAGALPEPPSVEDLDYHLTTLFPPVRPQGYLELRYFDAQPDAGWMSPAALVASLTASPSTVDKALDVCTPAADRWLDAARVGLADPVLAGAAREVVALGIGAFADTGLSADVATTFADDLEHRLNGAKR